MASSSAPPSVAPPYSSSAAASELQSQVQAALDARVAAGRLAPSVVYLSNRSGQEVAQVCSPSASSSDSESRSGSSNREAIAKWGQDEVVGPSSVFWLASCTKLLTAVAALQLVEDGLIGLDDSVEEALPELKALPRLEFSTSSDGDGKEEQHFKLVHREEEEGGYRPPITLAMLLSHTSGLSYPHFHAQTRDYCQHIGLNPFEGTIRSFSTPLIATPGTRWCYSPGLDWVGVLLERLTGAQDLDEYLARRVYGPLGVQGEMTMKGASECVQSGLAPMHVREADGSIKTEPHRVQLDDTKLGYLSGGIRLFSTPRAYAQVLVALLNGGTHPITGGKILSPSSVEELLKDRIPESMRPDLSRSFDCSYPFLSYPFTLHPQKAKQWTFAGARVSDGLENGRSDRAVWWTGTPNAFWFLDPQDGTCGVLATHLRPFWDGEVRDFWDEVEGALHAFVRDEGQTEGD
ncbi:beta-lactamase/transpeptidase-like protein [Microstroma glucosiphilum]|uniref:Beta-lactamase/transpeptidase-like protein n=1 Tax=Pseudomicrostroma glucosiphilum TaxID=1684307 RepID=A0A316UAI1_9BASI|nr:beta-lactamase/transpeptidase-like protein [Pseudomicrostroma glucosiphilum]PWN22217.1 beta-lactamase/transpeptidase-like protein [Pseudomicrostroma glucosiphilum]